MSIPKKGSEATGKTALKHVLDLFAKTVTSAVSLCRHAWLRSMDLQLDTKWLIEDLPFEGDGLFSNSADSVLQEMDKSIMVSRTLGASASMKGSKSKQLSKSWSRYSYSRQSSDQS